MKTLEELGYKKETRQIFENGEMVENKCTYTLANEEIIEIDLIRKKATKTGHYYSYFTFEEIECLSEAIKEANDGGNK